MGPVIAKYPPIKTPFSPVPCSGSITLHGTPSTNEQQEYYVVIAAGYFIAEKWSSIPQSIFF